MTDQIPADDLRRFIARCRTAVNGRGSILLDELEALLPAPPRPTMADMTMEERYACRWMQCDVRNAKITHGVIANNHGGNTHVLDAEGEVWYLPPTDITPRPDLPRLEWPGEKKAAPAPALPDGWRLADHEDHGRVVVTNPAPDCYGTVYFAFPRVDCLNGFDWKFCDPEELTYLPQ